MPKLKKADYCLDDLLPLLSRGRNGGHPSQSRRAACVKTLQSWECVAAAHSQSGKRCDLQLYYPLTRGEENLSTAHKAASRERGSGIRREINAAFD